MTIPLLLVSKINSHYIIFSKYIIGIHIFIRGSAYIVHLIYHRSLMYSYNYTFELKALVGFDMLGIYYRSHESYKKAMS